MTATRSNRDTIFVEDAKVVLNEAYEAGQYVLRVQAPDCALNAEPGMFAHIQCDPMLPMRRPLSIMRTSPEKGWVDFLYKELGEGTRRLALRQTGDIVSMMSPIGQPFRIHKERTRPLLLGGGVGIPPMVFLADHLRTIDGMSPLVLMGSEIPFPFNAQPSRLLVPGMPDGVIGAMPLLDEWGVPSRLASLQGYPGCHEGYITDLARHWISHLDAAARSQVELFACGPEPMLRACAELAHELSLPCQLSLEEYMACAVGGCAGCVVPVHEAGGVAMRRVCVDGPVFDAQQIYPRA